MTEELGKVIYAGENATLVEAKGLLLLCFNGVLLPVQPGEFNALAKDLHSIIAAWETSQGRRGMGNEGETLDSNIEVE